MTNESTTEPTREQALKDFERISGVPAGAKITVSPSHAEQVVSVLSSRIAELEAEIASLTKYKNYYELHLLAKFGDVNPAQQVKCL